MFKFSYQSHIYVCMHACMYVCIYIFTNMYINMHIYICLNQNLKSYYLFNCDWFLCFLIFRPRTLIRCRLFCVFMCKTTSYVVLCIVIYFYQGAYAILLSLSIILAVIDDYCLYQKSMHYGPWVKMSCSPFLQIKFYWNTNIHLFMYCLWPLSCYNNRVAVETIWTSKPKIFTIWPFIENVCSSLA